MNSEAEPTTDSKVSVHAPRPTSGLLWKFMQLFRPSNPASKSYRYLARQIEADLPPGDTGRCITFGSPGSMRLSVESLLMFSYFMQDELGREVLLIDATFGKNGVGAALGHGGSPGLMELLYDSRHEFNKLVQPTRRGKIFLLPPGSAPNEIFLPLKTEMVEPVLAAARERFPYVLVHQGSILQDTRHLLLTAATDLSILLVEEGVRLLNVDFQVPSISRYPMASGL